MSDFAEATVKEAALSWLSELGFATKHGPEIASGELHAGRIDFGETALAKRLRDTLVALRDALLPKPLLGQVGDRLDKEQAAGILKAFNERGSRTGVKDVKRLVEAKM